MKATYEISLNFERLKRKPRQFVIGTDIDYYKLFYLIKKHSSSSYLFESLSFPKHQDRYFTIGFDPELQFIAKGNQLKILGDSDTIKNTTGISNRTEITLSGLNPYEFIKSNIHLNYFSQTHQGGLIGYFSYESVNYFEPAINLTEHPDYQTFHLGLYTDGLIFDSTTNILYYYTFTEKDRSDFVKKLIDQLDELVVPDQLESVTSLGHSETKEEYAQAILNTLEEVRAGNTFQSEVGFKTRYSIQGDKISVYNKLREINPSPYMYYVKFDDVELLGASPEILVSSTNRRVLTTPAAGTIRRGKDPKEDTALARELLTDSKEIAEHNMLVDLHRNDISRVCDVGSVRVLDFMFIIRFSHVQHIVSDIIGELSKNKTSFDLLASILPGGVLTGTPKIETIKIIERNENNPRGPYGGAVGRFSFNGDSTFCLPIRSLFCNGDQCFTQTSSGVVYDSKVDREYEEVCEKLAAMEQTIKELSEPNE
jgi:anthranilate synthase component I